MKIAMSPQRLHGAPNPVRDHRGAWFPYTFRWAWHGVRATVTRLRRLGGQAEPVGRPMDGDPAAPPPDAVPASGADLACDPDVRPPSDPIPVCQGGPELPYWVSTEPGVRLASRQVQFILVVTADPWWGPALAQNLEAQHYLVLTAGSVREASEKLIIEPALLILDADLPDASGWDLLDWLARCGREVPVVLIAGRTRSGPRRRRLRPILVLPAPVALETLVAIVQEHLLAPETAYGA